MLIKPNLLPFATLLLLVFISCKKEKTVQEDEMLKPQLLNKILYTSKTSDKPLVYQLFTMNIDGTSAKQLTFFETTADYLYTGSASWSPDGTKILFYSNKDGRYNGNEIYIMNNDGKNVIRLTNNTRNDEEPCFSPDGKKILFRAITAPGIYNFLIMNTDGSAERQLTSFDNGTSFTFVGAGSWSPDGRRIAFTSNKDRRDPRYSSFDIYTMDSSGTEIRRLTNDLKMKNGGSYSPDGTKILFEAETRVNPSDKQIFTINADGSEEKQLTFFASNMQINTFDSCWSPDAQQILFISNKDSFLEGVKIFKMNADGTGINKLASNSMDPHTPDWR